MTNDEREQEQSLVPLAEAGTAMAVFLTGGGPALLGYLTSRILAGREARTGELHKAMADAIDTVKADIDGTFVASDEFEALTEEILEKGARRREINKRNYYAAAFANSSLPTRPPEAERYRFIDTLERLREAHLWLLIALLKERPSDDDIGGGISNFEAEFAKAEPTADMTAVKLDWADLATAGLVQQFPTGTMSTSGAREFRGRVTDLGRKFHQFVVLPYGDVHPR